MAGALRKEAALWYTFLKLSGIVNEWVVNPLFLL